MASLRDLLTQKRDATAASRLASGESRGQKYYGDNAKALQAAARAAQDSFALQIDAMLERLLDTLFKHAETSRDSTDQRKTLATYSTLYENKTLFFKRIEKHLQNNLKQSIEDFLSNRPTQAGMTVASLNDGGELSLVENSEMDRQLQARRLGARIENEHAEDFRELNGRLAAAGGLLEVPQSINPFRPEFIVLAIDAAWKETQSDVSLEYVVLERLNIHVLGSLSSFFKAASGVLREAGFEPTKQTGIYAGGRGTWLESSGVEQSGPVTQAPTASAPGLFQRLAQMLIKQQSPEPVVSPLGGPTATNPLDLIAGLKGGQQGVPPQEQTHPFSATQPPQFWPGTASIPGGFQGGIPPGFGEQGGFPGGENIENSNVLAEALARLVPTAALSRPVSALTHLQRAQMAQPAVFAQAMAIAPNLDEQGQELGTNYMDPMSQVDVALSTPLRFVNVVRNIAGSDIGKNASQVDQTVIELVARLFDFVFEDANLHDAIKVLLSRLQIPVLKAAMLDTEFFERDNHPARKLINALAAAGLGWEVHDGREDPLYQLIERVVQHIVEEFDEDLSLFDQLADEVREYVLAAEEENARQSEPEVVAAAEAASSEEDRLSALRNARHAVDERLHEARTMPFVAAFLRNAWSDYLGELLVDHQGDDTPLQNALDTADDLLWSVQPKQQTEERRSLLIKIPLLEKQLKSGIERVAIPPADSMDFFYQLDDRWAGAIIGEPIHVIEDVPLPEPEPEPDAPMQQILALTPGAILEMTKDDGARFCYKVGWISEGKSRFLLTNRLNSAPLIVTAEHLSGRLRDHKLRIIDRGPIVDRAMNSILSALEEVRYPDPAAVPF
jgi:hypothetical protein